MAGGALRLYDRASSRRHRWRPWPEDAKENLRSINSGFGFPDALPRIARGGRHRLSRTVDFVKMHPGFFDVIDALDDDNCVSHVGRG